MGALFKVMGACGVVALIIFTLVTCSAFVKEMDIKETESYFYEEVMINEGKRVRIRVLEKGERDIVLMSFMEEKDYKGDIHCIAERKGAFFKKSYENTRLLFQDGNNLEFFKWQDKYVFSVNDISCKGIKIITEEGESLVVSCGRLPFVYVLDYEPYAFGFLDLHGDEIK